MSYSRRQLYALGEPLGECVTRREGGRVVYGGGGGGGPSSSTVYQSSIPDWLQPQTEGLIGAATQQLFNTAPATDASGKPVTTSTGQQVYNITGTPEYKPFTMNQGRYDVASQAVAGLDPLQQQAMQGAAGLQMPGQFGAATGMGLASGLGAMGAGQQYQQMATNPYAMQAYMNPYIASSLAPQLELMNRQTAIQNQQDAAKAIGQGAYGGNRNALLQSQNALNNRLAQQDLVSKGYSQAFQNAQQAQQFGANLGLQGYQAAGQQAANLANIGQQQLAAQQGIIGTQAGMGQTAQTQQQNIINQAIQNYANQQQYPLQQLNAYNALLRGYAVPGQTATTYQAAPSVASQAAGLGLAGVGLSNLAKTAGAKAGGKLDVNEGIDKLALRRAMARA